MKNVPHLLLLSATREQLHIEIWGNSSNIGSSIMKYLPRFISISIFIDTSA